MYKLALPRGTHISFRPSYTRRLDPAAPGRMRQGEQGREGGGGGWKARKKAGIRRWKTKSHTHRVRGDINARCHDRHSFSASFSANLVVVNWKKSRTDCAIELLRCRPYCLATNYFSCARFNYNFSFRFYLYIFVTNITAAKKCLW